jgi:CheY-like chemotaxis protein
MNGRYIIFADDDADDLELITGLFKQYNRNVNVLEFRDGKEVMKFLDDFALKASLPQLIVLDINMPRMNGMETLVAIRSHHRYRHIPVVLYTTSTNVSDQEFCDRYGASWVSKSSTIEGVRQTAKVLADFCELQNR